MPTANAGLVRARHVFTKHKGMLRTGDAICLGVQGSRLRPMDQLFTLLFGEVGHSMIALHISVTTPITT